MKHLHFLEDHVKAALVPRIVVLGAESTGTTTLTKALANKFKTTWVPEYGRYYSESLPNVFEHEWKTEEFEHIANMQNQMEDALAHRANKILFCDTNAFATAIWHQRYLGSWSNKVKEIAKQTQPDLYVITSPDIPFEQDGIRDGEHIRKAMHDTFINQVEKTNVPFILVTGSVRQRVAQTVKAINNLPRSIK